MKSRLLALAATAALACWTSRATAQLKAFPGAEGAGQYATGGRGGDVYYVTNLNDAGAGSLRSGITSATGPRTILFKTSGTIHLQSDLDIRKSNLTIAGQSAPGGGITIAGRQTRVVDSGGVPTQDVILQHLRFRVGDTYTRTANSDYEPDALWIANSRNIMIDHVSASWGVDEVLSVTHGSHNVTVQWSTITEALRNAGHSKGNHGYGSIIDGGDITYHHNLYAHNDSRSPRIGGQTTRADIVNNVIYNPGFKYGYVGATDLLKINYVGNYGLAGPSTSATALLSDTASGTSVFQQGNFRDNNKNGLLDGTLATGSAAVSGSYTPAASRFDVPQVNTSDARSAYIQVLSRAGASYYRDPTDRRVIRDVLNQTGGVIDSQNQVGGWRSVPSLPAPTDSNNDGVPDAFAVSKGFSASANIGNQLAPNGYTWLENYLHSLTPHAYAPAAAGAPVLVRASADAQVNENGGPSGATSGGSGNSTTLNARWNGGAGGNADRNEYILLRFDLSQIEPGSINDARLELSAERDMTASGNFIKIYGVEHDAAGWDWDEAATSFSDAPGLQFDGNSATRGLDGSKLLTLGTLDANGLVAGETVGFDNPNLAVFLNLAAYFEGQPQDGLVTLLLERIDSNNGQTRFWSREAGDALAPRLVLDAAAVPGPTGAMLFVVAGTAYLRRRRRLTSASSVESRLRGSSAAGVERAPRTS